MSDTPAKNETYLEAGEHATLLFGFIEKHTKASSDAAARGIILIILAILSAFIPVFIEKAFDCNCVSVYYYSLGFAALIVIAAIVNFRKAGSSSGQADYYRSEQIVLRDLVAAIKICETIDKADFKEKQSTTAGAAGITEKEHVTRITRTRELIIQQLLNRCSK